MGTSVLGQVMGISCVNHHRYLKKQAAIMRSQPTKTKTKTQVGGYWVLTHRHAADVCVYGALFPAPPLAESCMLVSISSYIWSVENAVILALYKGSTTGSVLNNDSQRKHGMRAAYCIHPPYYALLVVDSIWVFDWLTSRDDRTPRPTINCG